MLKIFYRNFIIFTGFQLVWFFSVFGEIYDLPLSGFIAGIIYLSVYIYFSDNIKNTLKTCLYFASLGYLFDSLNSYLNLYVINSNLNIGLLPIWFITLWLSFATLFDKVLIFLKYKTFISILLGIIFVPFTYYAGIILGIAESRNIYIYLIIMIIFWGFYMYLYSFYLKKYN
ncbi:MAG: hypothetical protein CFH19_00582 [Alphaproteobacteria bacterium MarineAlpha5_Bin9]|nr:MAG: hypothetical protein CFH19_00582 [Alphaproteobacteria bacterium MarineAlpha5_Bin9]|tara:strand:+ start:7528 stop:8043 length:516 start_codon:yes stop_codon:yes gene_type:complete